MRKLKKWMLATILICGTAAMFTSCVENTDNPATAQEEEDIAPEMPALEIDPGEFQPIDVSVALLGSLGNNSADVEAARYWLTDVTTSVTDETMVVITDEINAGNEEAIAEVLDRFGTLLVIDPKEDNVRQYAEALGIDPNADYSKLELIGLTGFGDKFLSERDDDEEATGDIPPLSIAEDDIWDIAPAAYLRLKAFAQWVDRIDKKYTEYQKQLAEYNQAIADAKAAYDAGDEASVRRAMTRYDQAGSDKIDINTIRGIDISKHLWAEPTFKSYHNAGRDDDEDSCHLSVTINYSLKPLYEFPKGNASGADYYVVETAVNWDCSETLKGFKQFDHGAGRDRRSYLFFPIECKFYSEPIPTKTNYSVQMLAGSNGDLKPDNVTHSKSVTNQRSFSIDANVSGGFNGGKESGKQGETKTSNNTMGGNVDASLGIGANWSKTETFTVEEYDVAKIVDGQKIGHTITVPGGEDGYRPRMVNPALDKGFEVSGGVNFRKSLNTNESWVWKVSGTSPDTEDASIKVKVVAKPTVSWSSYFYTSTEWGVQESSYEISQEFEVPAPNRSDVGFLKINNTGDENGNAFAIFAVRAIDVTDPNNTFVAYENLNSVFVKKGDTFGFGLPAGKLYDIELEMGRKSNKTKVYKIDRSWQVASISQTGTAQELDTDMWFSLKNAE